MKNQIKKNFNDVLKVLIENKKILFPEKELKLKWQLVIQKWVNNDSMTLFVRKGGMTRGTKILFENRTITTTDNTPAHWVFKNIVFDQQPYTCEEIENIIQLNKFPISFIRKKNEYATLLDGMVADKNLRLNNDGWKLAHIERIAMKRGKNITLDDYKMHHIKFLDLSNMYLIDKQFSGLAEVDLFNDLVKEYIKTL